ncbi:MAG TPA: histidine kinase [Povalibacter sp.]|nr:histidine kinase [Povalibacter sp.]
MRDEAWRYVLKHFPIDAALPPEVTTAASQLLQYQRRPVFSWGWWWRRAIFLAPVAIIQGVSNGIGHGVFAHDAVQALAVAIRCALSGVMFIGGGTLLATALRHLGLRQSHERFLVVTAIVGGFFLWVAADSWAGRYHTELMCEARGVQPQDCPDPVKEIDSTPLGFMLQQSVPVGLYFLFGGGVALISYFREQRIWAELQRRQEREQLELKVSEADTRLSILQAQIEPHFLFNTLASLRSLVHSDPQRAMATIDALVAHLRATLPQMRDANAEAHATLGQQVEICRSYLEVMRVRMGSRLSYAIDVPDALALVPFPPLMLISLVENAVKHGVEPSPGPRSVVIQARLREAGQERSLEVAVGDDGMGLREGLGTGVGLANIRAQLGLRFGASASLELSNRSPTGVIATLSVPVEVRT